MANGNGSAPGVALVKAGESAFNPYEPASYGAATQMAADFAGSKLTKCRTKEQALLVMATGHELGIPATTALRMIYVADFGQGDQVALSADLMVALCLRSSQCEYFRCDESTDEKATYVAKRKGDPERTATFTLKDKERAKLGKVGAGKDEGATNWAKYPRVMLRHRAAAELAREVFPDVIGGFYVEDELRESGPSAPPPVQQLPRAPTVVDGEIVESKADAAPTAQESTDRLVVDLSAKLDAARSQSEGDAVAREIQKAFPDKASAERAMFRTQLGARKAAAWASVEEPPHDAATGEVAERQPGEEG
jgi:hypothetical protein